MKEERTKRRDDEPKKRLVQIVGRRNKEKGGCLKADVAPDAKELSLRG
jgi:hypothetical protein